MIQRSSPIIDKNKSKEFMLFLQTNAKKKQFWDTVKKEASKPIDKKELEKLFE